MSETHVLCVRRADLESRGLIRPLSGAMTAFHRLTPQNADAWAGAFYELTPVERKSAEEDPNWLQVIPYTTLLYGQPYSGPQSGSVFSYERGKSGAEARLHAMRSIGVGGHLNPGDENYSFQPYSLGHELYTKLRNSFPYSLSETILRGFVREVEEEVELFRNPGMADDWPITPAGQLGIEPPSGAIESVRLCGILQDDSTPVGTVHLGLSILVWLQSPEVLPREDSCSRPGMVPLYWLGTANLETWSRLVFQNLFSAQEE